MLEIEIESSSDDDEMRALSTEDEAGTPPFPHPHQPLVMRAACCTPFNYYSSLVNSFSNAAGEDLCSVCLFIFSVAFSFHSRRFTYGGLVVGGGGCGCGCGCSGGGLLSIVLIYGSCARLRLLGSEFGTVVDISI